MIPDVLFVDLDGTVRHGKDEIGRFVNHPDDVVIFPEALDRMREWTAGGGVVVGVTNQGGVGLGYLTEATHDAITERTLELCDGLLADVAACIHAPGDLCWCRKPLPGLLFAVLDGLPDLGGALPNRTDCLMVGDRVEDQLAATAAGVPFRWAGAWRAGTP